MSAAINWPKRKVGNVDVNAIGHGMMSIGGNVYGPAGTDEERFELLNRLWELGQTNWDTAHMYGDAEKLIGKWFAKYPERRSQIFLATKFGVYFTPGMAIRGDPEFIKEQLTESLERLQTDYIDLYYQHRPDPKVPIEVTVKALAEFIKYVLDQHLASLPYSRSHMTSCSREGKIKQYGLSDATVNTIRRAQKIHPVAAVQVEINPFLRDPLMPGGIVDTARELGIAVYAYSPNGNGLAIGRFKSPDELVEGDIRRWIPRYQAETFAHARELADTFTSIGRDLSPAVPYTAAQVCLAWLSAQGDNIIPIPGSSSPMRAEENCRAVEVLGKLSKEHMELIGEALKKTDDTVAKTARGPPGAGNLSFVETPEYVPEADGNN